MKHFIIFAAIASMFSLMAGCGAQDTKDTSFLEGYYKKSAVWRKNNISVCWENPGNFGSQRSFVKSRIADTWGRYSRLNFTGWGSCGGSGADIRIRIADQGAYVVALGSDLRNRRNGMSLNFTYNKWNQGCKRDKATIDRCMGSVAIHEFGHAIGFAHEHNRNDRDRDCTNAPQGTNGDEVTGPFDRNSIMNYCFGSSYRNALSQGDITAVRALYGR